MTQEFRPRLTCNDGCSLSVQASSSHYSTPRENHPDWHWSRFECVEVGYPLDAAGEPSPMPEDWAAYADYPPDGNTSKVYAFVPVRLVCEWIQAHGGLTCAEPCEPWFEQEPLEFPQSTIHCVWENNLDDVLDDSLQELGRFREELVAKIDAEDKEPVKEALRRALNHLNNAYRDLLGEVRFALDDARDAAQD
jgi:hypothetical protein